jgi:hypothetical protein
VSSCIFCVEIISHLGNKYGRPRRYIPTVARRVADRYEKGRSAFDLA